MRKSWFKVTVFDAVAFFQLHFAEETEKYILYALRATWSTVDNMSKLLKSVTIPIIPSIQAFYISPSHTIVYIFLHKCSGSSLQSDSPGRQKLMQQPLADGHKHLVLVMGLWQVSRVVMDDEL